MPISGSSGRLTGGRKQLTGTGTADGDQDRGDGRGMTALTPGADPTPLRSDPTTVAPRSAPPAQPGVVVESLRSPGMDAIVRSFPQGAIFVFDSELRYLSAGGLGLASVGLSRELLEGHTVFEVFPPDVVAAIEPLYRRTLAGEESVTDVAYAGRIFLQTLCPVRSADGTVIAGMGTTQDVTGARESERSLLASQNRFRSTFDNAPIGMALVSLEGRYLEANAAVCAMTGLSEAELREIGSADLTHPADRAADAAGVARLLAGEASFSVEKRYRTAAGQWRWAATSTSLVRDAQGGPLHFIGQVQDVTGRREQLQELREERRRLREAQSIGRVGSWEEDGVTRVVTWSDSLLEMYGIDRADFGGDYASAMTSIHPADRAVVASTLDAIRRTGVPARLRFRVNRRSDGALRWFDSRTEGRNEGGELMGLAGAVTDVTELVLASTEIERARDAALAASRAKSAFLAAMSHEIRTPLNAVLGLTEIVLDTELDAEQREYLTTVHTSGETLVSLIDDILDWSKVESGALELEQRRFDVRDCVEGAVEMLALQLDGRDLELLVQLDRDCPEVLVGDVTRIRQILVNLIGNAVKFTPQGHVVVTAGLAPTAPGDDGSRPGTAGDPQVRLRFAVTDTGIGIAPDKLDRLFRDFSQVDDSTTRTHGGTGLGLAISQRLAQAMGGGISVVSRPGDGSTFTVDLLLQADAESPAPARAVPTHLRGRRALVVHAHPLQRQIIGDALTGWGLDSVEVASLDQAADLLTGGAHFDLAVLDTEPAGAERLPELAGGAQLPAVLLGRRAGRHRRVDRARPVHPPDPDIRRLTTPVREAALFGAVVGVLTAADPAGAVDPARVTPTGETGPLPDSAGASDSAGTSDRAGASDRVRAPEPVRGGDRDPDDPTAGDATTRVLLVEDNLVNRTVAQLMLSRLGYATDVALNGAEAVAAAADHSYDIVLMDVEMPVMDGLEATRRLRRDPPPGPRPWVIALTASALVEDREHCAAAGMDDYLSKPVRREQLAEALRRSRRLSSVP